MKYRTHLSNHTVRCDTSNNPVQAVGAARGRENCRQYLNSVGVQHLPVNNIQNITP